MHVAPSSLPGVLVVTPERFGDLRGFFAESYSARAFAAAGIEASFVQDNHSLSEKAGTVRGLHFQAPPHAQAKLVRCGRGRIFDVAVDIRLGSPTFGNWTGVELSFENGKQLLVPEGFLHGFMTLEPASEIIYKCSDFYAPETEGSVHWASCGIKWPLADIDPILSPRDAEAAPFDAFESPFTYEGTS